MVFGMSFGLDEAGYEREHDEHKRDDFDEWTIKDRISPAVRNCRLTEKIATAKPASPAVFVVVGLERTPGNSSSILLHTGGYQPYGHLILASRVQLSRLSIQVGGRTETIEKAPHPKTRGWEES